MQIDPNAVKWDDAPTGAIDPKMVKWDSPASTVANDAISKGAREFAGQGSDALGGVSQGVLNMLTGAIRGAGSIGATIARPFESGQENDERRARIDQNMQSVGAQPDSWMYKGGKLGGEVAGTAGVGSVFAKPLQAASSLITRGGLGASPTLDAMALALQTGGFRTGGQLGRVADAATRLGAGGLVGGASAGLVNPEEAGTGALIGAALPPAVKVVGEAGRLIGNGGAALTKHVLGTTTGAGAETFGTAYRAGRDGGTSFLDNMRGNVPMTDVLDGAKEALSKMRVERGNQYRSGMVNIANDKSVIDFAPIDKAVNSLKTMGSYKGQVINKNAAGTVDEVSGIVSNWKSLDPAEYHTPEGLDALKKAIGDVRDATQFGTPGRKAADTAYNAVKDQINLQAPTYAKVMKDYSHASETLSEIEKALSLGNKAAADTSMRKLQSLMRNNVNTNYGNRLGLAKTLEGQGADILPAIAGQAASSVTPRGLQGLAATGAGIASLSNPLTLAALPFTSPRLMGELSYGLGAMSRGIGGAANMAGNALPRFQQGLLSSPANGELGLLNQFGYRALPILGGQLLDAQ